MFRYGGKYDIIVVTGIRELLRTKKIFFIWCLLSPLPVLATGINSGVSDPACDNSVMGTYSGNVALEAEYEANGIPIRWYDNNEEMTVSSAASSCDYGGNVTVAQNPPSRTGYVFVGWKLCSLSEIDTTQNGTSHGFLSNNGGYYNATQQYGLNESGTWATSFEYGIVYGRSKCSETNIASNTSGTPSSTEGPYCWCKATHYKPISGYKCELSPHSWVKVGNVFGGGPQCSNGCATLCGRYVKDYSATRVAVFSSVY